jgi:hypothetical protein
MGLFDLFKKSEPKVEIRISENYTPPSKEEMKIRQLKKQATENKKTDINKAIELMAKAIQIEKQSSSGEDSIISDYIRMAKYTYKAGRKDEAWKLYNDLLLQCAKIKDAFLQLYLWSKIYQAMGKQLADEKKYPDALLYCFLADICRLKSTNDSIKDYKRQGWSELMEDEKETLNNLIDCMFNEKQLYFNEKIFPVEKSIRVKLLGALGGREAFIRGINSLNLADFANKITEIIGKYKNEG